MKFIKILWQLPQNLIGLLIKVICKTPLYTTYKEAKVYTWKLRGGISFGQYIFLPYKDESVENFYVQQDIKHEYGHCIQSQYLGWFYLLVVGLPSIIWCNSKICEKYRRKNNISYYSKFPENWADKLGNVERK